jgi:hypothetical protein
MHEAIYGLECLKTLPGELVQLERPGGDLDRGTLGSIVYGSDERRGAVDGGRSGEGKAR